MHALLRELIPHAPNLGLFVAPDIPPKRLQRALADYASGISADEVIVLYDATRLGTGGDGAVFTPDRVAFQNHNLEPAQHVAYSDVVGVHSKRRLLGGRYLDLQVNRGRATVELRMDFSARPGAAPYVARFLQEALAAEPTLSARSNHEAVARALQQLVDDGQLSARDMRRMLDVLSR